jgi:hypothetical protein
MKVTELSASGAGWRSRPNSAICAGVTLDSSRAATASHAAWECRAALLGTSWGDRWVRLA